LAINNKTDLNDVYLIRQVRRDVENIFNLYMPENIMRTSGVTKNNIEDLQKIVYSFIFEDLMALVKKDPAARSSGDYILKTYNTFRAVMYYRVANALYNYNYINKDLKFELARKISEDAKKNTLVEIHPAAKIGARFVIDHGTNTVIGETSEIGEDCYILNGVILGAKKISYNPSGKRHPTLGNNVEVGPCARLIGPISIGNNVAIAGYCYIDRDIPPNSRVKIINQIQILSGFNHEGFPVETEIYGVIPDDNGIIHIYGKNLKSPCISIKDNDFNLIDCLRVDIIESNLNRIDAKFSISEGYKMKINDLKEMKMCISEGETELIIMYSAGLMKSMESLINN